MDKEWRPALLAYWYTHKACLLYVLATPSGDCEMSSETSSQPPALDFFFAGSSVRRHQRANGPQDAKNEVDSYLTDTASGRARNTELRLVLSNYREGQSPVPELSNINIIRHYRLGFPNLAMEWRYFIYMYIGNAAWKASAYNASGNYIMNKLTVFFFRVQ